MAFMGTVRTERVDLISKAQVRCNVWCSKCLSCR